MPTTPLSNIIASRRSTTDIDFGGTNKPIGLADPVNDGDAVNKRFVMALAERMAWKDNIRVRATGNVNLASPGASIDALAMVAGQAFLAGDQTNQAQNGIYIWNGATVPATRSPDASTADELLNAVVLINEGTYAGQAFRQTALNITLETTPLSFQPFGTVVPAATESTPGTSRRATQDEVNVGTEVAAVVTPATLANNRRSLNSTDFSLRNTVAAVNACSVVRFTIGAESMLAIQSDAGGFNVVKQSANGEYTTLVQTVTGLDVYDLVTFTSGADTYLFATNYLVGGSYDLNSPLYKWNGSQFVVVQNIPTRGALRANVFVKDSKPYLMIANSVSSTVNQSGGAVYANCYRQNLAIYEFNALTGLFVLYQDIPNTSGVYEANMVVSAGNWDIFASEFYNDSGTNSATPGHRTTSRVLRWVDAVQKFQPLTTVGVRGASCVAAFNFNAKSLVAVGSQYDGRYFDGYSFLYQIRADGDMQLIDRIKTGGCNRIRHFAHGGAQYIAVVNSYSGENFVSTPFGQVDIYRVSDTTIIPICGIPASGPYDVAVWSEGNRLLMAIAESVGTTSRIVDLSTFVVQKAAPVARFVELGTEMGQCRLIYYPPTGKLHLIPINGNSLLAGGRWFTIEDLDSPASYSLATTGLAANSVQNIYFSSQRNKIIASTRPFVRDVITGQYVRDDDPTCAFLGVARLSSTGTWAFSSAARHVLSHYNRIPLVQETELAAGTSFGGAAFGEVAALRSTFITLGASRNVEDVKISAEVTFTTSVDTDVAIAVSQSGDANRYGRVESRAFAGPTANSAKNVARAVGSIANLFSAEYIAQVWMGATNSASLTIPASYSRIRIEQMG